MTKLIASIDEIADRYDAVLRMSGASSTMAARSTPQRAALQRL